MIEITRPLMSLVDSNGHPIAGVTRSTSEVEAMEKASKLPDGVYVLERPDAYIMVSGGEPETEPEPEPEPEPSLPASIAEAQQAGLLPYYRPLAHLVSPDIDVNWTGTAGERDEIGYLPEQHSAYLAGQTDLESSILEAASQPLPDDIAHSHMPNLHWLPLLLTGDKGFVAPMEDIQARHMARLNRPEGSSLGSWIYGRELAWGLRHLSQLVWCQENGLTDRKYYRDTLDATRDLFLGFMDVPVNERWRVLSFNEVYWRSYGWSGWMESFIGIVLCRMVQMGFDDWRPIAQWHYEQLERRSGGEWSLKDADTDHMSFITYATDTTGWNWKEIREFAANLAWSDVQPYTPVKMADPAYSSHPKDEVIFTGRSPSGNRYTFTNRTQNLHQWAVAATGVDPKAAAKEAQLFEAIQRRGDAWEYRHAFARPNAIV